MKAQNEVDSVSYYYQKGNFKKAINICEKIKLEYLKEDISTNKLNYSNVLGWLAILNQKTKDDKKAEQYFIESISLLERDDNNKIQLASLEYRLGMFYLYKNKYNDAETHLLNSKNLYFSKLGDKNILTIEALASLADCYFKKNEISKAKEIYDTISTKHQDIFKTNYYNYATFLLGNGKVFYFYNDFKKAKELFLEAQKIYKDNLGSKSSEYLIASGLLAINYKKFDNLDEAEKLMAEILVQYEALYTENSDEFSSILYTYATIKYDQGNYIEAENILLRVLKLLEKTNSNENPVYPVSLTSLGRINHQKGDFAKAEIYFNQALENIKKKYGEANQSTAVAISDLASVFFDNANYSKAEELYLQSSEITKNSLGENHTEYATALDNLGSLYLKTRRFKLAEDIYLQSTKIRKNIYGENHSDFAISLSNMGSVNLEKNNFDKAEEFYLKASEILKKNLGEKNLKYIKSLDNLSKYYFRIDDFNKAEYYALNGLQLTKINYGDNNPDYSNFVASLGTLYSIIGNYDKSIEYNLKSLELNTKIYGKDHLNYINNISNLGTTYFDQKDYIKAEEYFLLSYELAKKKYGIDNFKIADFLNRLSNLYSHYYRNDKKSIELNIQALNIVKKSLGVNSLEYATTLCCLADKYYLENDFLKSEKLYLEALDIRKKILGPNHSSSNLIIDNLAILYNNKGDYKKEYQNTIIGINSFQNKIINVCNYLSEKELSLFRLKKFSNRFFPLSFLHRFPTQYESINIGCYESELLVKNLSLHNQQRISSSIQKSSDTILLEKYEQFMDNKRALAKLNESPKDKLTTDYEKLTNETETLEKELVRKSIAFAGTKSNLSINWKHIQDKLQPNEIAIDLVAFEYYNKKWTDSIVYGAFIIKKDSKFPKYISMFEEKQLEFLLHKNKGANESDLINKQYSTKSISDLFLKPLESDLKGVKTIYLSPSGLSHQIDFNALQLTETKTFGESYNIHILGSTSELVNYKVTSLDKNKNIELLLYGGIDFDKSDSSVNNETPLTDFNEMATRSGISGWNYLEGTVNEINQIATKAKQYNFKAEIKTNRDATEESIKKLDGKSTPYVLHLATHGFFFPDPEQEIIEEKWLSSDEMTKAKIYKTSEDPMMRSGLLLAGANKYWKKTAEEQNTDDGILTAKEISNLDLSACELVVMSACETGLGDIKGSEGVFGLQRAFKMAGVKNIIMSLWKVPDAQTSELFDVFYEECFSGKSIHDSFKTAQSKMKAKYSPYYWAGFVLLE